MLKRCTQLNTAAELSTCFLRPTPEIDQQLLCHRFSRFALKHNLYKLREERDMKPSTFGELVSSTLYEKR